MPIYEYLCQSCGRVTEVMQKVADRPPGACPECGSKRLAKLVSRSAFQLKGGGWYADLYGSSRKKGAGKEAGSEGVPGPGAPKAVEGKAEASAGKPEAGKGAEKAGGAEKASGKKGQAKKA